MRYTHKDMIISSASSEFEMPAESAQVGVYPISCKIRDVGSSESTETDYSPSPRRGATRICSIKALEPDSIPVIQAETCSNSFCFVASEAVLLDKPVAGYAAACVLQKTQDLPVYQLLLS